MGRFIAVAAILCSMIIATPVAGAVDPFVPSGDWIAHSVEVPIPIDEEIGLSDPSSEDWYEPIGLLGPERLEAILIYSRQGHAVKVKVDRGAEDSHLLKVTDVEAFSIPAGIEYIMPIDFVEKYFIGFHGETIYDLDYETLELICTGTQPSNAKWHSNYWNPWSSINRGAINLCSWTNDSWYNIRSWIPADLKGGVPSPRGTQSGIPMADTHTPGLIGTSTMGAPLIMDAREEENGSVVVLATDMAVNAVSLKFETAPEGGIKCVWKDRVAWTVTYEEIEDAWGHVVEPIDDTPISFASDVPGDNDGYDRVFLATKSGHVYSILRCNGTLDWMSVPAPKNVMGTTITGMWPSGNGDLIVTGTHSNGSFIALLDPQTGRVLGDGTWAHTLQHPAMGRPHYIPSTQNYLLNTGSDVIQLLSGHLDDIISFQVPGGVASPAVFVGNIINNIGSSQGNYYAVVRPDGSLFIQALFGDYIETIPVPAAGENPMLATIETDYGGIVVELFYEECPETVENFVNLSESGFYEGLTIHRVIPGLMIQGGCPNGDGTGGPGYTIHDEPSAMNLANGYGSISMANNGPGTAGSQFLIIVNESGAHHLDGRNAVFGRVVDNIGPASFISYLATSSDDAPLKEVYIRTVTITYPRDIVHPVATAGEDVNVTVGRALVLNGSRSSDDQGIAVWMWSYTLEGKETVLYGPVQNITFRKIGDVEVTLTVIDRGGNSASDHLTVHVLPTSQTDGPSDVREPFIISIVRVLALIVMVVSVVVMVVLYLARERLHSS